MKGKPQQPTPNTPIRDRTIPGCSTVPPSQEAVMALNNKRVLVFAEENYEDLELWYPKLRLIEAGVRVTVAGPREKVYKSKHGYPAETDGNVADFKPAD